MHGKPLFLLGCLLTLALSPLVSAGAYDRVTFFTNNEEIRDGKAVSNTTSYTLETAAVVSSSGIVNYTITNKNLTGPFRLFIVTTMPYVSWTRVYDNQTLTVQVNESTTNLTQYRNVTTVWQPTGQTMQTGNRTINGTLLYIWTIGGINVPAGTSESIGVQVNLPELLPGRTPEEQFPGWNPKYIWGYYPQGYLTDLAAAAADGVLAFSDPTLNLTENIVAAYTFDDEDRNTTHVYNLANTSTNLTINNTAQVLFSPNGVVDNSTNLTQSTTPSCLFVQDDFGIDTNVSPYTLTAWWNTGATLNLNSAGTDLFVYQAGAANDVRNYLAVTNNSGTIAARFVRDRAGLATGACNANIATSLPQNTWFHLSLSYNGSLGMGYVNGTNVCNFTGSGSGSAAQITVDSFGVGAFINGAAANRCETPASDGLVDEVYVYSTNKSSLFIQELYNETRDGRQYPFEETNILTISKPTTEGPESVSGSESLHVNFTLSIDGVNVTSRELINITEVNVSSDACTAVAGSNYCSGTANACSSFGSQSTCEVIGCTWDAGGASTSVKNATTLATNDWASGTANWATPGNAGLSDNAYATATLNGVVSDVLNLTNFGFSIAAGSTINGILVTVERDSDQASVKDALIQMLNRSLRVGNNKLNTSTWGTTDHVVYYGGASDTWGVSWTVDDINHAGFGVVLSANKTSTTNPDTVDYDNVNITIYYTAPTSCSGTANACSTLDSDLPSCVSVGCTNHSNPWNVSCVTDLWCSLTCTTPTGLSGLNDLTMVVNYTTTSTLVSGTEIDCLDYGTLTSACSTYGGSGNYAVTCPCYFNTNTNLLGNNFTMSGSGRVTMNANLTNWTKGRLDSCTITTQANGSILW